MPARASRSTNKRYVWQIRVELLDVHPTVWRRLLIPFDIKLPKLHLVLQAAFGWDNSHLHEFAINGTRYAEPDPDPIGRQLPRDERRVQLYKAAPPSVRSFDYIYDFGDHWHHIVIIENHHPERSDALPLLRCIDGANAAPPDDVGGHPGYGRFLDAIRESSHPEHDRMLEWIGGAFDPKAFDIEGVNRELAKLTV